MLAMVDEPEYDTTKGQTLGKELRVTWVTIDDPDPENAEENPSAVARAG